MTSRRLFLCSGLVLGLTVPALAGCGGSDTAATTTVAPSLTGRLAADPTLTAIAALLKSSGRETTATSGGLYTLFVPTNAALDAYAASLGLADANALVEAVAADPTGSAAAFLDNVLVEGTVRAADFAPNAGETFQTVGGLDVTIAVENGSVVLSSAGAKATVSAVDLVTGTVTVHVIDTVLR